MGYGSYLRLTLPPATHYTGLLGREACHEAANERALTGWNNAALGWNCSPPEPLSC